MSSIKYWRVILEPEWGVWETCRDNNIVAIGYPKYPDDIDVQKFRDEMKIGDKVVAYLKKGKIGALGTIVGEYGIDEVVLHGHYWRTRKVEWNHRSLYGWVFQLSKDVRAKLGQRGSTVVELSGNQYEEIKALVLLR